MRKVKCKGCVEQKQHHAKGFCRSCYDKQRQGRIITCKACSKLKTHIAHGLCRTCLNRQHRQEHPEYNKQYRQEHVDDDPDYDKQYRQKNPEHYKDYNKQYRREHPEQYKKHHKQYDESKQGKLAISKHGSKTRGLGFFLLQDKFLEDEVKEVYHHCNNLFVFAIPRKIHRTLKTQGTNKLEIHRNLINNWLKDYYFFDFNEFMKKLNSPCG